MFYRRLYAGSWAHAEARPFKNEFDLRDDDTGLSVFIESRCTAVDVIADGEEGAGQVVFVYEDVSPCFGAYRSEEHTNPNLQAAHVELRLRADPSKRRFPNSKLRRLAELAGLGLIVMPAPKK